MERRLQQALAHDRPVLVLTEHARQQIGIGRRSRQVNVYLDPILDRLAGTSLVPVEVQLEAVVDDDASWANLAAGARFGALAGERLRKRYGQPGDREAVAAEVDAMVAAIGRSTAPLLVGGVDVAPGLRNELQRAARNTVRSRLRERRWSQRLLAELQPAALLLANEYNRTEWIAAARTEGIPVAAVQHGIIHPWHPGYIHRTRPAELLLADRTYVFGRWECRLLVERSCYRPDEVVVGGSPRLDYVVPRCSASAMPCDVSSAWRAATASSWSRPRGPTCTAGLTCRCRLQPCSTGRCPVSTSCSSFTRASRTRASTAS